MLGMIYVETLVSVSHASFYGEPSPLSHQTVLVLTGLIFVANCNTIIKLYMLLVILYYKYSYTSL